MTSINSGGLKEFLYQRLFQNLDVDRSQGLSLDELKGSGAKGDDAVFAEAFKALDADGDGKVARSEMTAPPLSFTTGTLDAMIAVQASTATEKARTEIDPVTGRKSIVVPPKSESEARAIKALFSRADLDGNGRLSQDELKAEGALRRAANLDAGHLSGPIFVPRDANQDGSIAPDELSVGIGQPLRVREVFFDEMSPDQQKRWLEVEDQLHAHNPSNPKSEPKIYSADEKARIRQREDADWAERMSGPEGTFKLLDREIAAYRDKARAEFDSLPMTETLSARLMARILAALETRPTNASIIA